MSSTWDRRWAYFIVNKLGLPYKKKDIMDFASSFPDSNVWDKFVASNPLYKKVAEINRIYGPSDVYDFFEQASYAGMRSTFPSRARGRTVIGPRILSLKMLYDQGILPEIKEKECASTVKEPDCTKIPLPNDLVGKTVIHKSLKSISFGVGKIISEEKEIITVDFLDFGIKKFWYPECILKGYLEIIENDT